MRITTSLGRANVAITNLSGLAGTCAYDASDTKGILPSVHRDVDIPPKGTATIIDLLAPPPLSTYHVVLSCKGDFNGDQVKFGHVEQDVSSFSRWVPLYRSGHIEVTTNPTLICIGT